MLLVGLKEKPNLFLPVSTVLARMGNQLQLGIAWDGQ